jgi:hypothetical protein
MAHQHSQDSSGHSAEELPSYDDINTPVIVMVGLISALLTLLSVMFFQGLYYHWEERLSNSGVVVKTETAERIEEQKKALAGGGKVKSIEDGIEVVVNKYKR